MAKKIIEIGVQGNDGTGDSIREAFSKVNDNFSEIYAVFKSEGKINFSDLSDGCTYISDQLITASHDGTTLIARDLVPGNGIFISATSSAITIEAQAASLSNDLKPEISAPFNANKFAIGRLSDPSEDLVDLFNLVYDIPTTLDELPVTVGYANRRYAQLTESGVIGVLENGVIVPSPIQTRAEPTTPDITNPLYDPTLTGNYLSTEVLPRKDVVYRGGDKMTGALILNDHPGAMAGTVGAMFDSDLQAATAFYVDNKTFTSNVNLYVSAASGDDLQLRTPAGKEGRYWNYAFKSIGAALLHAESLINLASQEPGPYKQRISYTLGADQTFSTVQRVRLTGGESTTPGYVAAFNLLQANRSFIQSETISYINKKYVNKFSYNKTLFSNRIEFLIKAVCDDLLLGATDPDTSVPGTNYRSIRSAVKYLHDDPYLEQSIQWLSAIEFIRNQIIEFTYDGPALQDYTTQLVTALCYDLIFSSNYQSIQAGIAFKNAGTKVSAEQLGSMLTIKPINILSVTVNGGVVTLNFLTQSSAFLLNSEILIDAVFTNVDDETNEIIIKPSETVNNVTTITSVTIDSASTVSSVSFRKGGYPFINDGTYTVTGSFDRKNLINLLLLTPGITTYPSSAVDITANATIVRDIVLTGTIPEPVMPTPNNPPAGYNVLGHVHAKSLLLDNISFIQAEVVAYLSSEFPDVSYNRELCLRDVKYIIWSLAYDLTYGGNSQSVYAGKKYWNNSTNFIIASEKTACVSVINYINTLAQAVIINSATTTTYQQSVRQYRNDTLTNGNVASASIASNVATIAAIVTSLSNVPAIINPSVTTGLAEMQTIFDRITADIGNYTDDTKSTSTIWYLDSYFPVIKTLTDKDKINNLFDQIISIVSGGVYPSVVPVYPIVTIPTPVNVNVTDAWIVQATGLLDQTAINTIAQSTNSYIASVYTTITYNSTTLQNDIKDLLFAAIYDLKYGGTLASFDVATTFTLLGSNVNTQKTIVQAAIDHAWSLTNTLLVGNITGDTSNHTVNKLREKFTFASSYFSNNPPIQGDDITVSLFSTTTYDNATKLRTLILNSLSTISNDTLTYIDSVFKGGFTYDESLCYRDLGLIIDAMSIDLITGGTYQSINAGKSFYKNSSARAVSIGTQYTQSFDGIMFAQSVALQVLNKQLKNRYQLLPQITQFATTNPSNLTYISTGELPTDSIGVTGDRSLPVSQNAIDTFVANMLRLTDIIQYGISVAATPSFGSGIWNLLIDNGGRGYVDQGSPSNNDLFPAKVIVGVGTSSIAASNAYGSIVTYTYGSDISGAPLVLGDVDTLQVRLTKPGFFKSAYTLVDLNWSFVGTTVTVTKANHTITQGTRIIVNFAQFFGSGSNAPIGTWIVSAVTTNTFSFVTSLAPIGTSTLMTVTVQVGEQIEFGETVRDLQLTMFIESGIYYEDYPLRVSSNISIKGDEFRRTIIRPKDRISQSPWRKIFFYRDAIVDALEVGLIDYTGTNYAPSGITASLDGVTNKIVVTLSGNFQAPLSWVGKVFADTNTTNGNAKRGKAVVDSVSGNTINCTVIYPFSVSGLYAAGSWKLFGTINYGRHYLTNPLDVTSTAKNNKDIDVLLCNEGTRIVGVTFQGHGGFAMVLDPEGNIKTKSPYIQECASFTQSNNYKRFAGGQYIDGFAGRLYGNIIGVSNDGITVTVQGETNSGLDIRPPQPPCSFYVRGKRYQIDDIVSFDATTATVVLTLDKTTPYLHTTSGVLTYDDVKAKRDIGYVLDAIASDAALGTTYRSVHAGRSFLKIYSSRLVGDLQDLTIAGINKALELSNTTLSGSTYSSIRTQYATNIAIITSMISNGVNATPTIVWSTSSTADDNLARNIIQNNKAFIKSEISAYIAQYFTLGDYPRYNVLTSERDVGYVLDAMTYDMFYGGDSQTKDSAEAFFYNNTSYIPDENVICSAAYTRLKAVLAAVVAGSPVVVSSGNSVSQILTNPPASSAGYVTKLNTLSDIVIDYIADGSYSSPRTSARTYPLLPVGTTGTTAYNLFFDTGTNPATKTTAETTIETSVSTFLKNGANLRINIEAGGNRSMLGNDFAMFNDLAYGILATNGAFTEQVCTFTYYAHTGLWANNGSNLRGVGCSNTFGNYGMRASGYDVTELPDSTNLANHMIQTARVYKQGIVANEMIPTATVPAIAVWIIGYDYIPTNGSIMEINHSVNSGTINSYTVTSAEYTTIQFANQTVLKLNLNTTDTGSGSGLSKELYDGQMVSIRSLKNVKFNNVDNVKPTRPSTALQYVDNLNDVYRIIAYNLTESTGDMLGDNIAILQSDNSFAYYNFTTDPKSIIIGDPDSSIYTTVALNGGATTSTSLTVTSATGILQGHIISGVGFTGQIITNINGNVLTLSSAPNATPYGTVYFSFKTQGSKVGDTKIAVDQVSQLRIIDQINKGTYITAWNGRLHRVLRYVTPTFAVSKTYASYNSGTSTMVVTGSAGSITAGMLVIKRNATTEALEFTGTVVSATVVGLTTEVVISTPNQVVTPLTQGPVTFGVTANGYIELSPNAFINNAANGVSVNAMTYLSSDFQVDSITAKVVTFDIPFSKDNLLPKVDSYLTFAGNSNASYNGEYQITRVINQTLVTLSTITDFVVGMVVTSQVTTQFITNSGGVSTFTSTANHNMVLNDPVTVNVSSNMNGLVQSTTYYVKTIPTSTSFTLSATSGGTALGNFGIVVSAGVVIISIATNLGVSTFTTNTSHGLVSGNTFAPNISTNSFVAGTTYYVKDVTSNTFTLSATSGGLALGNFGTTNVISSSVSFKTPQTAIIPGGSAIIQSVSSDPLVKTIVISPAAWVPANSPIRASLAASVMSISITSGGSGYTSAPSLTIEGGSPTQRATATCTIVNGEINEVRVIIKGSGYVSIPSVTVTPAVGNIPTSTAVLSVNLSTAVLRDATSTTGVSTIQMSALYPTDPGTFGTVTSITVSAETTTTTTYNSVSGYSMAYTVSSGSTKPANDTWCKVEGNSNALYNGFFQVISTASTTITLFSPLNPGIYGTGTTTITSTPTNGTSTSLGISKPFSTKDGYTFNIGYAANTFAQVTTRISTCRATGHDFCDIGTGGYSTTNIPYSIYGEPALSRQVSHETLDESVGRCFYVSTNQDGIFRVGKFFSVDQGTGVVTLSSKTALSNIEAFGFSGGGAVVNEFSTDSTLTDNSSNKVPVESAVRGYIDKRLGIDHGGSPLPFLSIIGPGFVPLNGSAKMTGDLVLGGNGITGVRSPISSSDVVTKGYLEQSLLAHNSLNELDDVTLTTPSNGQSIFYDSVSAKWRNAVFSGDVSVLVRPSTTLDNVIVSRGTASGIDSEFTCDANVGLFVGQQVTFSGTYSGSGLINGYTNPSTYFIIATNGTTTFQLSTVKGGVAVTATAGTLGLTVTVPLMSIAIGSGRIVNSMISSAAKIDQSKLSLNLAGTSTTTGGTLGVASFSSYQFSVDANGWVTLANSSSETTGTTLTKLQHVPAKTVLSNLTDGSTNVVANSASEVVRVGEGIQLGSFTSVGVMTVTSVLNSKPTGFAVVGITTTGEGSKIVKTGTSGGIDVAELLIDGYSVLDVDATPVGGAASAIVQFKTPGNYTFLTATGNNTVNNPSVISVAGTLDVTGTNSSIKCSSLSTGSTGTEGTLTGAWKLASGSSLDFSAGFVTSSSAGLTSSDLNTITRPALILDFANSKTLDPRISFTRNSIGTYTNAQGLLVTASVHQARFDFNPTTGVSKGLLIEEQRTNVLCGSASFAISGGTNQWVDSSISRGVGSTSPAGTATITFTASAGNATIISNAVASGTSYRTFSIWLKREAGTGDIQYTLNNGATWTTQAITSTLTRYSWSASVTNASVGIRIVTSGNSITMWGAQLEDGAFATSYIPTTTAAVIRRADVAIVNGTNFSRWYRQAEGTFVLTHAALGIDAVANSYNGVKVQSTDLTASMEIRCGSTGTGLLYDVKGLTNTGTTQFDFIGYSTLTVNTPVMQAFGYKANDCAYSVNGDVAEEDTVATIPTTIAEMVIGGAGAQYIERIAYYPRRLTNLEIRSLTSTL
jgi:hypothetical protein